MFEIVRPSFIIDKEICLRNIARMAEKAATHGLRFRPHFKTHQSAKIGEWFRAYGVNSIAVSSVLMAGYFAASGWKDITIAFPLNILEINEVNRLAAAVQLGVVIENTEAARALVKTLNHPVSVYIKIDTGYNRTGIVASRTGTIDTVLEILSKNKLLDFKGFLSHAGHTYQAKSTNEIYSRHFDALMKLKALRQKYDSTFPNLIVSTGDTPSCSICGNFEGIDEIRPGNFVFYDVMQHKLGVCSIKDIAVRLVCPVVSKHLARNEIVIYGGAAHLSKDSILNVDGKRMYGRIALRRNNEKILLDPLNYVSRLSQEHGTLKITPDQFKNFQIGDLVEIIPVHSCLTANLMGYYYTTDGELIERMPKYA